MKTLFKRLLAILIILSGGFLLVFGTIMNLFVKLPNTLEASHGSGVAGILLGTLLGTAVFIAISCMIISAGTNLWRDY